MVWFAVGDRVVSLSLPRNGLSGSLPDRFGELDRLVHLDLSHNLVDGGLPDSMYVMDVLENLNLADNRFRMGGTGLNSLFAELPELKYLGPELQPVLWAVPLPVGICIGDREHHLQLQRFRQHFA